MLLVSKEKQAKFEDMWYRSGVEATYISVVDGQLNQLVENLNYTPDWEEYIDQQEFEASIEMLAYTTTECLAQLCAGGVSWAWTDKARFLSPTVDFESMVRRRLSENEVEIQFPFRRFTSIQLGAWDFLLVAERTRTWFEALNLSKDDVEYLLWASYRAIQLLGYEERIPGFTYLALTDEAILNGFCQCESPIESVLYMQFVVDGLRPPILQSQLWVDNYRLDFAIPDGKIAIECDGKKYHDKFYDRERDKYLGEKGWFVLRFSSEKIFQSAARCAQEVHLHYPWSNFADQNLNK